MEEHPAIEGEGRRGALVEGAGVFVSQTRGLYRFPLVLSAADCSGSVDFVEFRRAGGRVFPACSCAAFELRIMRENVIHAHVDVSGRGKVSEQITNNNEQITKVREERFRERGVRYEVDGVERDCIYGLTLSVNKLNGTKVEAGIHRILDEGFAFPAVIENLTVTARLFRDTYEDRQFGRFVLRLSKLLFVSDETMVQTADAVIGPVRYFAAGDVTAEVFEQKNN
jgi:hypothetical protein